MAADPLRAPLGLADQPSRDQGRLDGQRIVHLRRPSSEQLRGEVRPRRIRIAAMRGDARQARSAPGDDERPHLSAGTGEDQRHVGDIRPHQHRRAPGLHEVMGEHDDRRSGRDGFVRRAEPGDPVDVDPGGFEGTRDGLGRFAGPVVRRLHSDAATRRRGPEQRAFDAPHERVSGALGRAERDGDGLERGLGNAVLQLANQPLLPRFRVLDHGHRIQPELQGGRRAPQRRKARVQSQHAPILGCSCRARGFSTGRSAKPTRSSRLGRSRQRSPPVLS
ncbi:hypothetical protein GCM10017690_22750 [Microbacterium terregens]